MMSGLAEMQLILADPEVRKRYQERLAFWDEKLRHLTEANRRAGQITGNDLNIVVGPCCEQHSSSDVFRNSRRGKRARS